MIRTILAALALASCTATPALAQTVIGPEKVTRRVYLDTMVGPQRHTPKRFNGRTYRGIDATVTSNAVRIGDGSKVTFENGTFRYVGPRKAIVAGFVLGAGDLTLRNVTACGFRQDTTYPNGDGVMAAKGTRLTVIGGTYCDNSDGGIDTKGDTVLDNPILADNALNLRSWGRVRGSITSIRPLKGHVQGNTVPAQKATKTSPAIPAQYADIHLSLVTVVEDRPTTLVGVGKGQTIIIDRCEGKRWPGGRDVYYQAGATPANTVVRLGPGCKAPSK